LFSLFFFKRNKNLAKIFLLSLNSVFAKLKVESMKNYHELMSKILRDGIDAEDRTGVGTRSIFGYQLRWNLQEGFPMVTTKKVHWKSIVYELLWFLRGESSIHYLKSHGVSIWDEWADENLDLGPVYGVQWRRWKNHRGEEVDQVSQLVEQLQTQPHSRRHILSAWNVGMLDEMKLPPCHAFVQFYVRNQQLSCQLYQRSADVFLGVPFNIASYSLLTHMLAQVCQYQVGEFILTLGDAHLYHNHFEQVQEQLSREEFPLPSLILDKSIRNLFDFDYPHMILDNYQSHGKIKAPIAV
jgi:thymidylate synthase